MTSAWRGNNFKGRRWEAGRSDIWIHQHELQKGEINILGTVSNCIAHKSFVGWSGRGRLGPHHGNGGNGKKAVCPAPGTASGLLGRGLQCLQTPLGKTRKPLKSYPRARLGYPCDHSLQKECLRELRSYWIDSIVLFPESCFSVEPKAAFALHLLQAICHPGRRKQKK